MSQLTIVVKVTDQCNLYCGYCYYYANGNEHLRTRKEPLAKQRLAQLGEKIALVKKSDTYDQINLVLHGGEPLLIKPDALNALIEPVKQVFGNNVVVSLQTNGVLIDDDWLDFFFDQDINVGVSIDAVDRYHDERRPGARGRPSFEAAKAGFDRLRMRAEIEGRPLPGVIAVYDDRVSAQDYWDHFVNILQADRFDILFPDEAFANKSEYDKKCADYSKLVDEIWVLQNEYDDPNIRFRFFRDAISKFSGMRAGSRYTAEFPALITVDLQGSAFYDDGLRHAINADDLKIGSWLEDEIVDLAASASAMASKLTTLPEKCTQCNFLDACGGGELTYRYSPVSQAFDSYALCEPSRRLWGYLETLEAPS